jgi:mono/diheme cytochrome c family protein
LQKKRRSHVRYSTLTVALALLIVLAACAQPTPTSTPVAPTTAAPAVTTAGQLAVLGKAVYDRSCSACHAGGPGPTVSVWMQTFPDAQKILDYASKNMPKSAPGSLQPEEYFQVVAWALVDQRIVSADAVLDISKLAAVAIPK